MRNEGIAAFGRLDRFRHARSRSTRGEMSAMGQSRRFDDVRATSASPLITDLRQKDRHVRFVPSPEVSWFLDHFVGAFFLAQTSRLYKQEAREVLV